MSTATATARLRLPGASGQGPRRATRRWSTHVKDRGNEQHGQRCTCMAVALAIALHLQRNMVLPLILGVSVISRQCDAVEAAASVRRHLDVLLHVKGPVVVQDSMTQPCQGSRQHSAKAVKQIVLSILCAAFEQTSAFPAAARLAGRGRGNIQLLALRAIGALKPAAQWPADGHAPPLASI